MKKTGLIALALVLALGAMGVGLAYWNETLTISGTVATGELDVEFSHQKSNDDGDQLDPCECGEWTFTTITDPTSWTWAEARYDYDVGSTTCELFAAAAGEPEAGDYQKMVITVDNAYPCYYGNVAFTIDNIGTIPVHIESIKLVAVSLNGTNTWSDGIPIVACETWYIDADAGSVRAAPWADADFSIHLSELNVCQEIAVDGAIPGDICVHVLDGAAEDTTYDFSIEIVVTQFNAPAP